LATALTAPNNVDTVEFISSGVAISGTGTVAAVTVGPNRTSAPRISRGTADRLVLVGMGVALVRASLVEEWLVSGALVRPLELSAPSRHRRHIVSDSRTPEWLSRLALDIVPRQADIA
jgi:hypothetical protein